MSRVYTFAERLAFSQSHENAAWWQDVYRKAFGTKVVSISTRSETSAQHAGIDRRIICEDGRTITVDEKVRAEAWNDILLERWSDEIRRIPGWIQKPQLCDYLAYAFITTGVCYLMPMLLLKRAWRQNGRIWIGEYREVRAKNPRYTTVSVAVPIEVLLNAVRDSMMVSWK